MKLQYLNKILIELYINPDSMYPKRIAFVYFGGSIAAAYIDELNMIP